MEFLRKTISDFIAGAIDLDTRQIEGLLQIPPDPALGDLSFPCFILAGKAKKNPALIAKEACEKLEDIHKQSPAPLIRKVDCEKAYLNIHFNYSAVLTELRNRIQNGSWFTPRDLAGFLPEKIMVEYSQPNTHKIFHVGHLRNVCIGDSLVRILRYSGRKVVSVNYIGDVGTHIAECLWYLNHSGEDPPDSNRADWLGNIYTKAKLFLEISEGEEKEKYRREISKIQMSLEGGEQEITSLWKETRSWSLESFWEIYRWLGISFDHYFYESEVEKAGKEIVDKYLEMGIFKKSRGAVIADLEEYGLGVFLVLKSDGTSLYNTKDLALAKLKFDDYDIESSWYVVGSEQNHFFSQLFKVLEIMGYDEASSCRHISYELVMLPEGKMSSRKGNVFSFEGLKDEIVSQILNEHLDGRDEWSEEQKKETAGKIAVACLKYGMLSKENRKRIVFDKEKWLKLEGDTGGYLLYTLTRIRSIFRKAKSRGIENTDSLVDIGGKVIFSHEMEWKVVRKLLTFNDIIETILRDANPSHLSNYLQEVCKTFSRFYSSCPVLKDGEARDTRLLICRCTERTLVEGLDLLGIEPVDEM